jgi:filamentous hemagglutinin
MSPIEHIFYRHGPNSGFENVGKFSQGTKSRHIASMVNEAISFGKTTFNADGKGGSIVYDFRRKIGIHRNGVAASRLQIFFNEFGEIMTAYPLK